MAWPRPCPGPAPLPLAGAVALEPGAPGTDDDPTMIAPASAVAAVGALGAADVSDLTDDDLDLDPPDWVSRSEPHAPVTTTDPRRDEARRPRGRPSPTGRRGIRRHRRTGTTRPTSRAGR